MTKFNREHHHFSRLKEELAQTNKHGSSPVRIWSAGCSTGEEPYEIAVNAQKVVPIDRLKILATDIDYEALRIASRGVYPADSVSNGGETSMASFGEVSNGKFSVSESIKNTISFRQLNLISSWNMKTYFDYIFCRNVAIYFDDQTQIFLWRKLINQLKEGGVLFIGHSEIISDHSVSDIQQEGPGIYRRLAKN